MSSPELQAWKRMFILGSGIGVADGVLVDVGVLVTVGMGVEVFDGDGVLVGDGRIVGMRVIVAFSVGNLAIDDDVSNNSSRKEFSLVANWMGCVG